MPLNDDLRTTLTKATPLYFAAGTADLAAEKLRGVPELLTQLRAQAPERFAALRDTGLTTVREQAQSLALRGAGRAAEYAVKARETYDELTERGRDVVETWRGDTVTPQPAEAEVRVEREASGADTAATGTSTTEAAAAGPDHPVATPPHTTGDGTGSQRSAPEPTPQRAAAAEKPAEKPSGQKPVQKAASEQKAASKKTTGKETPGEPQPPRSAG